MTLMEVIANKHTTGALLLTRFPNPKRYRKASAGCLLSPLLSAISLLNLLRLPLEATFVPMPADMQLSLAPLPMASFSISENLTICLSTCPASLLVIVPIY